MGDLAEEDGKDENRAVAQPGCKEDAKLHVGADGQELQTLMLVFKLALGSFLLFLFCYMNWVLLTVMAILVCCVIILKLAYHEQHDAGHDPVDHNAQPIPQIPRQDHEQETAVTQHTPEIPKQEHEKEHQVEEPEQEKYERGQQIHEIEDHLQAGNHLDKHQRKEHKTKKKKKKKKRKTKKKKKKKVDGIAEGILEGVLDATTITVDIATGGILSSLYSIFRL